MVAPYNDLDATTALIQEHAAELAAVLVEPMLGSGGCIPADADFLRGALRRGARRRRGLHRRRGDDLPPRSLRPGGAAGREADLTTYGKYIGGGFSFGAFGGSADLLDQFDTRRPDAIPHAGTFNNNVATMAAGCVVLGELFTADVAEAHTARGEQFRGDVAAVLARHALPVAVTGTARCLPSTAAIPELQELLFLGLYLRGIYTAPAG